MNSASDNFIQLEHNPKSNLLFVKWSDEVSVESDLFFETIVTLFTTIQERKITKILVDSGKPAGGVLTEEVINYFIAIIPGTTLQHIAILESTDYLWDQNLLQVINLLILTYQLTISVKVVKSQAAGEEWLLNK